MTQTLSIRATPQDSAVRLDVFLARMNKGFSRSQIKRLIESGNVQVGRKKAKAGMRLKENDVVLLHLPEPKRLEAKPEPIPLEILYEDRHLIVVEKPAGMVVHPAAGNYSGTLVNALLHHCSDLSGIGGVLRPGIVHRLDKDTSGVLVAAKDDLTHRGLSEQFKRHLPSRQYIGIIFGHVAEEGQIAASIGRHPADRKKMSTRPRKGREARTSWKVLKRFGHFDLVELRLDTGRTHQIRVHLSSLGHPLLGDPLYGGRRRLASVEPLPLRQGLQKLRRQALHAVSLGFVHPATGARLDFFSPLPVDLQEAVEILETQDKPEK